MKDMTPEKWLKCMAESGYTHHLRKKDNAIIRIEPGGQRLMGNKKKFKEEPHIDMWWYGSNNRDAINDCIRKNYEPQEYV